MVDVEAEHFSLRWNNFHSNLSSGFQALLHEEDLVDVTLAAGGEFVQAHKIVLSVCSPYFKQLFKVNPCKHPIVILKDVSHKDLVDILQFMYRGEVNVRQEDLAAFLKTAELLQVKGLTGQDSPSSPESYVPEQPRPRPAPKSRAVRAPSEKHNKVPQSIPISPTIVEDTPVRAPPYKRMRSEPPPPTPTPAPSSPRPQGESVAGAGSVEYVGLNIPKQEPVDSEVEDMEEKHDAQDDPLLQLLAGDSNHGGPGSGSGSGSGQGMGSLSTPMAGIPSASQDSQDGSQGTMVMTAAGIRYKCTECGLLYTRLPNLRVHQNDQHRPNAFPLHCVICKQWFKNRSSLRTHMGRFHRGNSNKVIVKETPDNISLSDCSIR